MCLRLVSVSALCPCFACGVIARITYLELWGKVGDMVLMMLDRCRERLGKGRSGGVYIHFCYGGAVIMGCCQALVWEMDRCEYTRYGRLWISWTEMLT